MKHPPKRVSMWVHPEFRRKTKVIAAELGLTIQDITKDLLDDPGICQTIKEKKKKEKLWFGI